MRKPFVHLGLFLSQLLFGIITPFLLMPDIAKLRVTRSLIAFGNASATNSPNPKV
jgi:hypothetical protein